MTLKEKLELFKDKGWSYNPTTGSIYSHTGNIIEGKNKPACLEGFRFVGMELDEDYFKIAEARVNAFEEYRKLLK